jgi:hypothetical protein
MNFNNSHLSKSFEDIEHKRRWWQGKLVKVRSTINTLFINTPPEEEIGIVVEFLQTSVGDHLRVHFVSYGKCTWVFPSDVFTQDET